MFVVSDRNKLVVDESPNADAWLSVEDACNMKYYVGCWVVHDDGECKCSKFSVVSQISEDS